MPARVPLDVDLEDKLLYGLTPMRLGYIVVAILGGFGLWSSQWALSPVRASACLLVIAIGAAFAWGRWRGRAADGWMVDIALFAVRSYRFAWRYPRFVPFKRPAPQVANAVEELASARSPEPVSAAA